MNTKQKKVLSLSTSVFWPFFCIRLTIQSIEQCFELTTVSSFCSPVVSRRSGCHELSVLLVICAESSVSKASLFLAPVVMADGSGGAAAWVRRGVAQGVVLGVGLGISGDGR